MIVEELAQDLRIALRAMSCNKGFAAAALVTIALAIGLNTAVFSVVYGVALRPLPYPEADRLVKLSERRPGGTSALKTPVLSNITFHAWIEKSSTIEGIAAYGSGRFKVAGKDHSVRVDGASVSPALFPLMRAVPQAGRFFRPEEARQDSALVVLSDSYWRQQFGANPEAIGSTMVLDDRPHTIIGVAPGGFYFPDRKAQFWVPEVVPRSDKGTEGAGLISVFRAVARLKPGASVAQAAAEGTAAARGFGPRPMAADMIFGMGGPVEVIVRPLLEDITSGVRPALLVLTCGVGLVLLIACVNVANLFLSRGLARSKEIAMRYALGATRARLVRQLLTESTALTSFGGVCGVLLAWGLIRTLPAIAPQGFPRLTDIRIDGAVLAYGIGISLLAGLIAGAAPAFRSVQLNLSASLHAGTWISAAGLGGARASRLRGTLLVAEAAFATMLLIGAGLLIRSFEKLIRVDPGYNAENVLLADLSLPAKADAVRSRQYVEALLERLRISPGIIAAGAGNMAPFNGMTTISGFQIPPGIGGDKPKSARALQYRITQGYAEALGLHLREGRFFSRQDLSRPAKALIVNEEFVRQYLGGPITGRQFSNFLSSEGKSIEILGVVGNILKDGLEAPVMPEIFLMVKEDAPLQNEFSLAVRTAGDPTGAIPLVRSIISEIDRDAVADRVEPLSGLVRQSVSQPRFSTSVLSVFAAMALILAAVGLYGVLSYNVALRQRELAVRAALGASPYTLVGMILREGMVWTIAGLLAGIAGAAALSRIMTAMLFGVSPYDPLVFVLAPAVLVIVAAVACLVPARRAAAADPCESLRSD